MQKITKLKYSFVFISIVFFACLSSMGCSHIVEVGRTLWGTSTRALEDARIDAISMTYNCRFDDCFDAVLDLTKYREADGIILDPVYKLFQKNRLKGYIVIMGVEGNVDTTEVGIFFSLIGEDATKIEVTSLASSAKRKVAENLEVELNQKFSKLSSI